MGPLEYKEEGNRLFREGNWRAAIEHYTLGLQADSDDLAADKRGLLLSNRSQCWLNLEEWQHAVEDADACLQLLPDHTKSLFRRATAREKLGQVDGALADYVKVVRGEPQNQASVEGAKRLREQVLRSGDQRLEEVLPSNLLGTLRGEASAEQKVDACARLRALCVRKGMTGTLMSNNALELLTEKAVELETALDVREAVLATLVTMASGHEDDGENELDSWRQPAPSNSPLPVTASALEVRKRLHSLLPISGLRYACRMYAKPTKHLAVLLGFTHEPQDTEALEAVHDAIAFVEEEEHKVPRAGITALATMLDTRRRLGKQGKPVVATAPLLKCVETALGTTTCTDPLRTLMAAVFAVLADDDRPKDTQVDLALIGLKMLEPFLQSHDVALRANGLNGFAALLAAKVEAGTQLLQQSSAPLLAILTTVREPPLGEQGRAAQDTAAECMLLAAGDRKTRQAFIEGDGIDIILNVLHEKEGNNNGLIRAKLVAVLAIIAAHNKDVREEVFDRMDFLVELRHALDLARERIAASRAGGPRAPGVEESRRLINGLYESCACLTIHGEFKEQLLGAKKTLKAMQDTVSTTDLAEDPHLAFLFTSLIYNLCRSREDKVRPKKNEFPFNELDEEDLNALEEFYEKMPAESRPVKNGEVDPGSVELAAQFRALSASNTAPAASTNRAQQAAGTAVVANLAKCAAHASVRVKSLVALTLRFLCAEQVHRRYVVTGGGFRALLRLVDLEEEVSRDAARQALAQLLIVTNPTLLQYSEQLDAVRPLVEMFEHRHELYQFEAAMGLTNLLTVSEELRSRAIQADAWLKARELVFSDNEQVQRAGLETMCNLSMASEILERFATGKGELELKVLTGFCHSEDPSSRVAASGALAMLAACEEVASKMASSESFGTLLEALESTSDSDVQHRLVATVCAVCESDEIAPAAVARAKAAVQTRRTKGFVSLEAESLARSLLDQGAVSVGGA